jgi:hypothetical protein
MVVTADIGLPLEYIAKDAGRQMANAVLDSLSPRGTSGGRVGEGGFLVSGASSSRT